MLSARAGQSALATGTASSSSGSWSAGISIPASVLSVARHAEGRRHLPLQPTTSQHTRIRKLYWDGTITRITNSDGQLETRDIFGEFAIDFQNSDRFSAQLERDDEIIPRPFVMAPGITIPAAGYNLETARIGYGLGPQRPFTGTLLAEYGPFYGGRRAAVSLSAGRFSPTGRLSLEPTYAMKWSSRSTDYFDGDVDLV